MHAWPEVYFSGIGWVPFEPTTIQPEIVIPDKPVPILLSDEEDLGKEFDRGGVATLSPSSGVGQSTPVTEKKSVFTFQVDRSILFILLATVFSILIGFGFYKLYKNCNPFPCILEEWLLLHQWTVPGWLHAWALYAASPIVSQTFFKLRLVFRLVGVKSDPSMTVVENADKWISALPELEAEISELTRKIQEFLYSSHQINPAEIKHTATIISRIVINRSWKKFWRLKSPELR